MPPTGLLQRRPDNSFSNRVDGDLELQVCSFKFRSILLVDLL
jgi:hypothetical protein